MAVVMKTLCKIKSFSVISPTTTVWHPVLLENKPCRSCLRANLVGDRVGRLLALCGWCASCVDMAAAMAIATVAEP